MKANELMIGDVTIPVSDYASQGNAILGIRDSGKTYTATLIAEQLHKAGVPFVAFDPIGVWRFLRHPGRGPGIPVVVAGGEHGDIPLTPENVEDIVSCAQRNGTSLVIDLFDMELSKADWRRIVERAVHWLLYANKNHGLRHIIIEEAAEFCPQMVSGEHAKVYSTIEKLARMGGNVRLGVTLINQRAEQLNKAVLELCDCILLHRQKGTRSIQALEKWLSFSGGNSKEIARSLPTLEQGACYVWAGGEESPTLARVQAKQTFTPNRREQSDEGKPCDVTKELKPFAEFIDARPGRKLIGHLNAATGEVTRIPEPAPEPERIIVFADGSLAKLELLVRELGEVVKTAARIDNEIEALHRHLREDLQRASQVSNQEIRRITDPPKPAPIVARDDKPLGDGHRKILSALSARYPMRLTLNQLGTICVYTPSTMRTYMPRLRELRYLESTTEGISITPAGKAIIGKLGVERMPTGGAELLEFWMAKLSDGEGNILKALVKANGRRGLTRDELEEITGYTTSTVRTYLPTLRRNGLIDPTELRAMPEFYQ